MYIMKVVCGDDVAELRTTIESPEGGGASVQLPETGVVLTGTMAKCNNCLVSKSIEQAHPKTTVHKAAAPPERVYTDLTGPISPASKGVYVYVSKLTDELTRYKAFYLIRSEDEAINTLVRVVEDLAIPYGRRVDFLRSDGGGEYRAGYFQKYCKQTGTLVRLIGIKRCRDVHCCQTASVQTHTFVACSSGKSNGILSRKIRIYVHGNESVPSLCLVMSVLSRRKGIGACRDSAALHQTAHIPPHFITPRTYIASRASSCVPARGVVQSHIRHHTRPAGPAGELDVRGLACAVYPPEQLSDPCQTLSLHRLKPAGFFADLSCRSP